MQTAIKEITTERTTMRAALETQTATQVTASTRAAISSHTQTLATAQQTQQLTDRLDAMILLLGRMPTRNELITGIKSAVQQVV
jgi:hypothetical protein